MPLASWLTTARDTLRSDRRTAGALLAAGVAFRLFLMMLPLALVTAAVLGFTTAESPPGQLAGQYGLTRAIANVIADSAREAKSNRWILLLVGLALLVWTGNGVVQALSSAFRFAWQIDTPARRSPLSLITVVVGLTLAVGLSMLTSSIEVGSSAGEILLGAVLLAGYFLIWLLISRQLPHHPCRWAEFVPGALLVAIGFVLLHLATALFVANRVTRASQLYGSFGLVSTLMLWLFIMGRVMVASAQLNAILWRRSHPSTVEPEVALATAAPVDAKSPLTFQAHEAGPH